MWISTDNGVMFNLDRYDEVYIRMMKEMSPGDGDSFNVVASKHCGDGDTVSTNIFSGLSEEEAKATIVNLQKVAGMSEIKG